MCILDLARGNTGQEVLTEANSIEEDIQWRPAMFLAGVGILSSFALVRVDPLFLTGLVAAVLLVFARVRNKFVLVATTLGVPLFVYIFLVKLAGVFFPVTLFYY
jgi:hypothetical protein